MIVLEFVNLLELITKQLLVLIFLVANIPIKKHRKKPKKTWLNMKIRARQWDWSTKVGRDWVSVWKTTWMSWLANKGSFELSTEKKWFTWDGYEGVEITKCNAISMCTVDRKFHVFLCTCVRTQHGQTLYKTT